jgi:peroxiredoxin
MEKWKIAVIAALLLSLVGFGIYQQNEAERPPQTQGTPAGTPKPSSFIGQPLPAWNFKTWNGKPVSFESLRGKVSLVEIFRIECPHCQDAAPFMVALQKRYGARGLNIVAIQSPGDFKNAENPENSWKNVQAWIKENGINYPVAMDEQSKYFQGTIKEKIFKGDESQLLYPTTVLMDKTGKVIEAHTGYQPTQGESVEKIKEMLVRLEQLFPGPKSPVENAKDLVKWMGNFFPDFRVEGPLTKAIADDIAQQLKK